jgi:membrane-anchored protein YejM (alkaline phosphatase superfamily)
MGLFRQYDYQLGVFASSEVHRGVGLDRTVLARFPTARQLSGSPNPGSSGRDRRLTDEWYQWLDEQDRASPFFGFLYYNAVVAIEPPDGYPTVFPDPQRFAPAASVRALPERGALRRRTEQKLLDNLIVIIKSDHGMELDENGLGFSGHAGARHPPHIWNLR